MATQVANRRNRQLSAQHSRQTKRAQRINAEYRSGSGTVSGDFKNKAEQQAWKNKQKQSGLTQQQMGNRKQRYNDIVAAFGRASKNGSTAAGAGLSFSGG